MYPTELYDAEQRCLDQLRDPNRLPSHLIVLPGDLWGRLTAQDAEMVRIQVAVVERFRSAGVTERFTEARR